MGTVRFFYDVMVEVELEEGESVEELNREIRCEVRDAVRKLGWGVTDVMDMVKEEELV